MKPTQWQAGIESTVPAIELFLKHVLLRKCKVQVTDTSDGSNEDAVEKLSDSALVVRAVEGNFQTEILFGFNEHWIPALGKAILGVEGSRQDEISEDLIREFSAKLVQLICDSLKEIGVQLEVAEIDLIKKGQLNRALNLQQYVTASLEISQTFDIEGDGDESLLKLAVVLAHPDADKMESVRASFGEENPFENGLYQEASMRFAGYTDLNRAEKTEKGSGTAGVKVQGSNVEFETFDKTSSQNGGREVRNIDILKNVEMNLSVELGRREMPLGKILQLVKGSVIELEKLAGEPVEILVNGRQIARGDVVVIDEHFGVRISNLMATQDHIKELG